MRPNNWHQIFWGQKKARRSIKTSGRIILKYCKRKYHYKPYDNRAKGSNQNMV